MGKGLELELQDIAWQKKDLVQKRRQLDSEITAKFLSDNGDYVRQAVRSFIEKLEAGSNGLVEHYYLKGGNAIAVLEGGTMTGDYDFQLVPAQSVYLHWKEKRKDVERLVFSALEEAAKTLFGFRNEDGESLIDESAFQADTLRTGKDCLNRKGKITGKAVIGTDYYEKSYSDILRDPNYDKNTGRMELEHARTSLDAVDGTCGYHIYANYTIPGFLLYRLVLSYGYELMHAGKKEEIPLKSEIIDVSIPRVGSAECYLSQEGVITHFCEKDGFHIPGWGYHFYENINLLQEVSLHYSGSPHKRGKRMDRLKKAINALAASNGGNFEALLGEKMMEDTGAGPGEILAYAGAVNYPVGRLANAESAQEVFKQLNIRMLQQTTDHMTTVRAQMSAPYSVEGLAKLFVVFRAQRSMDTNIIPVGKAVGEVERLFQRIRRYQYSSPFKNLPENMPFNTGFVIISVGKADRETLLAGELKNHIQYQDADFVLLDAHCQGGQFYMVLQTDSGSGRIEISIEQMLKSSILFSQRLALQEA